ncbi:hypothetical protein SODALDRAFT_357319 [Sodiomyces alkalinus F11]|uniref:Uncharacterized protein n=1 Tax=Sodiomyces alkalinus (strain CBS 110278 / VKM F-3762 / F11) TaxID=1314773 RepID=A0A3N2Q3D9_SODAK|nr:hypothetical protein SODALDRAFT_357319 [Sodiomyces alkalinus F11]ROT41283.1 hypothetical protein SODALDRAFT_357319 [Sodiomyces alkalinus F11]
MSPTQLQPHPTYIVLWLLSYSPHASQLQRRVWTLNDDNGINRPLIYRQVERKRSQNSLKLYYSSALPNQSKASRLSTCYLYTSSAN